MSSRISRHRIILILAMVATSTFLMYGVATLNIKSATYKENAPLTPPSPRSQPLLPPSFPLMGKSVSLGEAIGLANNTRFSLEFPTNLPSGLKLTDIRVSGVGPLSEGSSTLVLGTVLLIYSEEPLPRDADAPYLLNSGGLLVLETKRFPKLDEVISSIQERGGQVGFSQIVTVNGRPALYGSKQPVLPFRSSITWADKEVKIEIVASPDYFTQNDLVSIAASFK